MIFTAFTCSFGRQYGSGESTNLHFVEALLAERRIDVVVSREPDGTEPAENIRNLLLTKRHEGITPEAELLLMFATRSQVELRKDK